MRLSRAPAFGVWAVLAAAILVVAGCASTPGATPERDAEAKRFIAPGDSGAVYVYRPDFLDPDPDDPVLYVGDRLIGSTLPRTFFRVDLTPGTHLLRGMGPFGSRMNIDVRAGELYFVHFNVLKGGRADFSRVDPQTGQRVIRTCCNLLENWAEGQRIFPFNIR